MANAHRAYSLDGLEVEGYQVRISHAAGNIVKGELRRTSRTPLPFTIEAQEHQFDVTAVRTDIWRAFVEYIRREGLAPAALEPPHLMLSY